MLRSASARRRGRGSPHPLRWRILAFLGVAQLMLILDVTVVAIALPHMETDLGLSRAAVTWTVSAYTLTFGGLMLLGGRVADLAGSPDMVVSGRVAQGVGAALLSPAALSLVVTLFDGDERNRALGVWAALGGGGAALGVLLGGLITAGPGWPWVFFINVPIGLMIVAALAVMLPATAGMRPRPRLDLLGALLVTGSSAALIYALIQAGDHGWLTTATGALVLLALAGYTIFAAWQKRVGSPLMDVTLLARRPVTTGAFLILMATALMVAVFFLGTFYFQHTRGYGALHTGLLFLPVAVATMAGANLTGRIITRVGARPLAIAALVVAASGLALPVLTMRPLAVAVGIAVAGAGTGALFVIASATALGQVAWHEAGIASGIVSTFHAFGASIGAAVVSSVAAASLAGAGLDGFHDGFLVAALAAAGAAVIAGLLTPATPRAAG
ncbi:MFS transporter [Actinoplanes sp. NPDC051861]|uniref:MFS transporter n=1 Tax=Actinoplanes sp. NPDC051861 TaxID=3155170 RepID=UPI003442F339